MSVKKEEVKNTKFSAKGFLRAIDDMGFHVEDEKTGEVEVLSLDDLKTLIDKLVNIGFANKEMLDEE